MSTRSHNSQQGFALIIVGALFVAFAMITAAVIDRTNATKQLNLIQRTQTQMSRLSDSLLRYSLEHGNRYPCPADITYALTGANFGKSIAGCNTTLGTGVTALTNAATIRGMVPVMELLIYGADPNDAFDAWGNRIMYIVDRQMTPNGTAATPAANRPAITDSTVTPSVVFRDPDYILLSYGRDGVGATPKNSTSVAIACTGTEARVENCDTNLTFFTRPIATGPSLTSAQYFDDILVFFGR